jgi:hypothetical protein
VISLTIGGKTFTDVPLAGGLVLESLGGWFDGPPVRGEDRDHPQAHGSFGLRAWRGSRLIDASVSVLVDSPGQAGQAQRWLASLLADGEFDDLVIRDPSGAELSARVRIGGQPLITWAPSSRAVRAALQFWAPDPLRYGQVSSVYTSFPRRAGGLRFPLYSNLAGGNVGALDYGPPSDTGRMVLANPGTAASWPQFNVDGPVSAAGFEIVTVGSGARLRFEGGVPAGSSLVLDAATGTAVIDGSADRGGLLTWRDWAPIPAAGSSEFAFIPLGASSAAVLTASVRPAFW